MSNDDENEVIEDIKGHQEEGKRFIPLTDTAKQILDIVKQLNPNSEYLFVHDEKPLATEHSILIKCVFQLLLSCTKTALVPLNCKKY